MHMVARRRAGHIVRKHGFSCPFVRLLRGIGILRSSDRFSEVRIAPVLSPKITAGLTLLFWRIIPDDIGILLLRDLALSGRPQALFTWRLAAKASGGPTDTALLPTQGSLVPPAPRRHKKACLVCTVFPRSQSGTSKSLPTVGLLVTAL